MYIDIDEVAAQSCLLAQRSFKSFECHNNRAFKFFIKSLGKNGLTEIFEKTFEHVLLFDDTAPLEQKIKTLETLVSGDGYLKDRLAENNFFLKTKNLMSQLSNTAIDENLVVNKMSVTDRFNYIYFLIVLYENFEITIHFDNEDRLARKTLERYLSTHNFMKTNKDILKSLSIVADMEGDYEAISGKLIRNPYFVEALQKKLFLVFKEYVETDYKTGVDFLQQQETEKNKTTYSKARL